MAFAIPDHLPRAGFSHEGTSFGSTVSSAEPHLKKLASLDSKAISHEAASSLLRELEQAVEDTKEKIRSRVSADLPAFETQLQQSQLVYSRLRSLTASVEDLDASLNSESGLRPAVFQALRVHSDLAQLALDENTVHGAFLHLANCRNGYITADTLVNKGQLTDAVAQSEELETMLNQPPGPLKKAQVMLEMQRKLRTLQARIQELLSDAYRRCIVIKASGELNTLSIISPVEVAQTSSLITLKQVLECMQPDVVQRNLTGLRKDILVKFIDPSLSRPASVVVRNKSSLELQFSTLDVSPPLKNLNTFMDFISRSLFPSLPQAHSSFSRDLYPPTTESLLVKLLQPAIPSQISQVPPFLALVAQAVQLEQAFRTMGILPVHGHGTSIEEWCNDVGTHYEKKRREALLQQARDVIVTQADIADIRVDVPGSGEAVEPESNVTPRSMASSGVVVEAVSSQQGSDESEGGDGGWDFDDEPLEDKPVTLDSEPPSSQPAPPEPPQVDEEEDGWGFDDDIPVEEALNEVVTNVGPTQQEGIELESEDSPTIGHTQAKPARRLEKYSARQGSGTTSTQSPGSGLNNTDTMTPSINPNSPVQHDPKPVERPKATILETYIISAVARNIFTSAQQALQEGHALQESDVFSSYSKPSGKRGSLLLNSAPSIIDLYRALHPPLYAERQQAIALAGSTASDGMRLFNDCNWLASQIDGVLLSEPLISDDAGLNKLTETRERLRSMAEAWYDDSLDRAVSKTSDLLSQTERFLDTGDDFRFAQYQGAVGETVREITIISDRWKNVLALSKYYEATGLLVDECLKRIVDDIVSLPDIPELESHRLGDLCRLLNPLEELFAQQTNDGQHSMIVNYVPLWLKFSYLTELLVASLADISYLFEQGALVDFDIEELIRLIRALFSDTPIRAKTIQKISSGHPA